MQIFLPSYHVTLPPKGGFYMKNKFYKSFKEAYDDLVINQIAGYPKKIKDNEWILVLC